jgi:hypothetical protein
MGPCAKRGTPLLLLLLILCGAGFYWFRTDVVSVAQPGIAYAIEPTEQDFCAVPAGEIQDATFSIANRGDRTFRIVGFTTACGINCCYREKSALPMSIPPGAEYRFVAEIKVHESGPFEAEMELYIEDNGVRCVPLCVRGQGVANAKP